MKSIKVLLLMVVAFFATSVAQAQIMEPVSWNTEVKALGNNEFLVTYTATMEPGWSIYDLGPYEDGPCATIFTADKNEKVELIGKVTPVVPAKRKYDPTWGMEIGKFYDTVSFTQKVKLKGAGPVKFVMVAEWQSCDATSCTPPTDEELVVTLK